MVLGHHALFLDAEHLGEACPAPRHKGGARFGSRHGNAPGVGGEKPLGEVAIGRGHLGDPGQGELLQPPILQGAEDPLRPAPGFRGRGGNERDPQWLSSPRHLRRPRLVHLAPRFRRMPVVRASIGLQRTEQALGRHDRLQPLEAAHRPFFLDEEG